MLIPIITRLSLFLLLLTLPSAQALPARSAATDPAISPFGMNSYFSGLERISRDGASGRATLMERGRAIGVEWAREELSWATIEGNGKGRWNWSHFDQRLREVAEAGYHMNAMLLTTPAWARVADCSERRLRYAAAGVRAEAYWCPPASTQDFADFVAATVERYDGDTIADAPGSPRVAVWQIWNEPNAWETWPGSPAEYAAILEAGYNAAKAADPTATVATGGLYIFDGSWNDGIGHRDGLSFLNDALAARPAAWLSFDVLAVHPYMPTAAPDEPGLFGSISLWGRLTMAQNWLAEQLATLGGTPRPLWISEIGWSTCSSSEPDCPAGSSAMRNALVRPAGPIGRSEEQQANYLVRSYAIALALGVEQIYWFQLEDKFDGAAGNFWEEAAILRTAALGYAPKPAATAYDLLTSQLAGKHFVRFGSLHTFQHDPGALHTVARFHLRFQDRDDRTVDLLWRNSGEESVLFPLDPGRVAEVLARDGSLLAVPSEGNALRLTLNEAPIYVRQTLPADLGLSHDTLFVMVEPGAVPQVVELRIFNRGSGAIDWSATSSAVWLRVEPAVGVAQQSLAEVIVDPTGRAPGLYEATLQISSSAGSRAVPVRLIIATEISRVYLPLLRSQ